MIFIFFFYGNLFAQESNYIPPATSVTDRQFNFHIVDKNVWRSSQPNPEAIILLKKTYGLKSILNLRSVEETNDSEKKLADSLKIKYISFPMDARLPQNKDTLKKILDVVKDTGNYPILIHCLGGKDRTGLIVALYKMDKYNTPVEELITEMVMYGHDSVKFGNMIKALEQFKEK